MDTMAQKNKGGARSRSGLRKRFDRMARQRIEAATGRRDVVGYLADMMPSSPGYVSQMLDAKTPRRSADGRDYATWTRLKRLLTDEEIALLEEMETAGE